MKGWIPAFAGMTAIGETGAQLHQQQFTRSEEGEEAEKDREELASLHHENKTKSDSYEDDKEAIDVDAFANKDEEGKEEKDDDKKDE